MKKRVLLILTFSGILISSYLFYAKLTNNPLLCLGNAGCSIVQNSQYSTLLGIPLGLWGMGYYFILFTVFYVDNSKNLAIFRKLWIIWGILFSTYLTGIEAFVLNAYCYWCLASFINILIINFVYFGFKEHK